MAQGSPIWPEACPHCGSGNIGVVDSRSREQGRVRRRRCFSCDFRWSTLEVVLMGDVATLDTRDAIMKALVLTNEIWSLLERARDLLGGVPVAESDDDV